MPTLFSPNSQARWPKGGLRLILTGHDGFMPIEDPRTDEEKTRDGLQSSYAVRRPAVPVKGGMLINLGRMYRGSRNADMRPDGRAATRRRRQMERRT